MRNFKFKVSNLKFSMPVDGFSLIELLIVVSIIGVLSTLLMANFIGVRQRARDAERKTDLRQTQTALQIYHADTGYFPTSIYSTSCPTSAGLTYSGTTYMSKVPCDPLQKTNYNYIVAPSGCDNSATLCTTYSLTACLENVSDSEKDDTDGGSGDSCGATGVVSFTVVNP